MPAVPASARDRTVPNLLEWDRHPQPMAVARVQLAVCCPAHSVDKTKAQRRKRSKNRVNVWNETVHPRSPSPRFSLLFILPSLHLCKSHVQLSLFLHHTPKLRAVEHPLAMLQRRHGPLYHRPVMKERRWEDGKMSLKLRKKWYSKYGNVDDRET